MPAKLLLNTCFSNLQTAGPSSILAAVLSAGGGKADGPTWVPFRVSTGNPWVVVMFPPSLFSVVHVVGAVHYTTTDREACKPQSHVSQFWMLEIHGQGAADFWILEWGGTGDLKGALLGLSLRRSLIPLGEPSRSNPSQSPRLLIPSFWALRIWEWTQTSRPWETGVKPPSESPVAENSSSVLPSPVVGIFTDMSRKGPKKSP